MSDQPKSGDLRACPKCDHFMITIRNDVLKSVSVAIYTNGNKHEAVYGQGWQCQNEKCRHVDLILN